MPEGCLLLIPTGRGDREGGETVGGDMVGTWRPRALDTQTVMIDKERWFPSHTPSSSRERPNSRGIRA